MKARMLGHSLAGFAMLILVMLGLAMAGMSMTAQAASPYQQCDSSLKKPLGVLSRGWSREYEQTRNYSMADAGLTADDLSRLELKWAFAFADTEQPRSLPAITKKAIFYW